MPNISLTNEQVVDLVKQLPPTQQDEVFHYLLRQRWEAWVELSRLGQEGVVTHVPVPHAQTSFGWNEYNQRRGLIMQIRRLEPGDRDLARRLFVLMASVFEEDVDDLSDDYLDCLLERADFWALAALVDDIIVGGLTAHALPLTRSASSELLIYDLAVRLEHQRQGVGRRLVAELRSHAAALGIGTVFVPADNEDAHALAFYRAIGGTASPVTFFTFTQAAA
jgi:aminoglycoside 3-N-acetyltransferase I